MHTTSKINGVEYDKYSQLTTRMLSKSIVSEGHGRDFSWWEETYQEGFIVATSKNLELTEEDYSNEEIKNMIKNKQIVHIANNPIVANSCKLKTLKVEEYKKLNIDKISFDIDRGNPFYSDWSDLLVDWHTYYIDIKSLKNNNNKLSQQAFDIIMNNVKKKT